MTLDLNAIAIFVRVVEFKSFSETSKRLSIPISTISRKVTELEKQLGIRLLERSTRKLRLTELGQEYYLYCQRGLDEIETGALIINDRQSEVIGTLRISIPPNISDILIIPLVCDFLNNYPKTTIKILVTERNVDLIEDGVDIAFRVGELQSSSLIARQLLSYRHLLVASPQYIKIHGDPNHPANLTKHRLITFIGWQDQLIWQFHNAEQEYKLNVKSVLSINEMTGIQYAAEANQGIAEIPAIICAKALQQGKLVEVMPEWHFSTTKLSIIYTSNRNISRLLNLFTDYSINYIKQKNIYTGI